MAIKPLLMTIFDDASASVRKRWIVKGLIARGEISSLVGPPASGKSALWTHMAMHVASGKDCFGHRVKEACGVLIFALERGDLDKRRMAAYRQRDGLSGLPIAIVSSVIDLLRADCVEIIVTTVREAERKLGREVGVIVIDPFNKAVAVGGGDEDKAKDQNRVAAHLRKVQEQVDVHIGLVGHTGKDEKRGPRGSNARLGDDDVMIQIAIDGNVRVARVTKANDQPERDLVTFQLKPFELGKDEDGDPIDVAVIEAVADQAKTKKPVKLSKGEWAALRELNECVADHAEPPPTDPHCPPGSKGVRLDTWRERLHKRSVIQKTGSSERSAWSRLTNNLRNKGRIGIWDDFVWPV